MPSETRTGKSILNAKIGAACYVLSLLVSFFSRGIFLRHLGTEFIGLVSSLSSLLGFLNIAELGISTAVSIVLYKPLFNNDRSEITQIVSILGYLYRCVALIILVIGVLISILLPWLFSDTSLSLSTVYFGYYSFLFTTLVGYFFNYHTVLLSADQRNYYVIGYYQVLYSTKVILQLVVACFYCSYAIYFSLEILFGICYSVVLHKRVSFAYPWLCSNVKQGKTLLTTYPAIQTKVRQMFVHKIGSFVQNQSMPLFIYAFISLPMVALYGNYMLVAGSLRTLIHNIMSGTTASVGNLVSEGRQEHIYSVYKELLSVHIWIAGVCAGCLYYLASDFISLWLGPQYVLPSVFVLLVCVNVFLYIVRDVTDQFLYGYGLVQDVWSPIVESILFIFLSVLFGQHYGLNGLMLAPLLSLSIIIYGWKPYYLFSRGFKLPILRYLALFLLYLVIVVVAVIITGKLLSSFMIGISSLWLLLIVKAICCFGVMCSVSTVLLSFVSIDFRHFIYRIIK